MFSARSLTTALIGLVGLIQSAMAVGPMPAPMPTKETITIIFAFDPFQADLFVLQMQDDDLQMLQTFMTKNEWPPNLPKQDWIYFKNLSKTRARLSGSD